jgi:error-prone DNA polymerase
MTDYIELHARSAFSFLEGASLPESLMASAADLGMPAMALLDRNGVYGAPRFHTTGQKLGVQAHIGAEIAVHDLGQRLRPPAYLPHQHPIEPVRLPLLVESRIGYQNLCRLITRYKMREDTKAEGAASQREVEQHSKGLVCLTGGEEGPLAAALSSRGYDAALKTVENLTRIFGEQNVYIELQRHFNREEEHRNRAAVSIARSLNLPLLATGGVSHATAHEREVMDVFTCIRHKKRLDTAGRLLALNAERHLRSAKQMRQLFFDYPEAIASTKELSSRLRFEVNDLGYQFPAYPVPDGQTMDSFLRQHVNEGIRTRYQPKNDADLYTRAQKQAERELRLIEQLGLAGYFLIVWDIVQFCKRNSVLVQGRGSAANSVVCYALEITAIDPVGMGLLFERFLSEERGEWPDIDIDLPSDTERERAIQYVYQRYGELGAAMTANVTTYRGKSASREAGKVLGFDSDTLGRLTSLVGAWEWRGPNDTLENSFRAASFDMQHPRIAKYLELCQRIQDLPRNLSQHSGGMVICQGHLDSVVPLERASMPGRTVVQWDKEDCADMKIIKVDLLGLGMMAVMKDCVDLVPRHYAKPLDLAQLPHDDDEVYKTLQRADTVGMFQVESRAQMSALPRNRPEKFYDLVVQVAIIRPGPIVGKMMHPYMLRRQNKQAVTYPHPRLIPVLERTLGVPLFQEQLIRIAMEVANFTGGEAEELRRAVGMRRSRDKMKALEAKLRKGMTENNVAPESQEQIVQAISSFALYGFPESHAASFALIAYASAYIKQHYLAAFTCAMLNNQPMGFYSPATLISDAKRHGLKVLPIDVQHSEWLCTLEQLNDAERSKYSDPFALRLGFRYARGLHQQTGEAIAIARKTDGPFASEYDVQRRVPEIRKSELTLLAKAGALNWTGEKHHRRTALWRAERAGQLVGPLFENVADAYEDDRSAPLALMNTEERLVADFKGTGMTIGPHPMSCHRTGLNRMGIIRAADLHTMRDGVYARIAGCVIARQRPGTASGFVFLSLEDESGISNAIIHPDLYESHKVVVTTGKFLLVEGTLQNQDGVVSVKASGVRNLALSAVDVRSHDFH